MDFQLETNILSKKLKGHLLILIKNKQGYQNLINLHNNASPHEKKPYIPLDLLLKNCEGLVISTACIGSIIAEILQNHGESAALSVLKSMKKTISQNGGEFYLELMPHDIYGGEKISQQKYNKFLEKASKILKIPIIITTDAHYTTAQKKPLKLVASALFYHRRDIINNQEYFPGNSYHLEFSKNEIEEKLIQQGLNPETIKLGFQNTENLARRLAISKRSFKIFEKDETDDQKDDFEKIVFQKWETFQKDLSPTERPEYYARLIQEILLIKKKKYCNYFLTLHKIMNALRGAGIEVGISRGSGGGSLAAFLLGLTFLDPIKFKLLFERFLNEAREDPPDIDIDIQMSRREEAIQITQNVCRKEVCGKEFAQISTFITFQSKSLERDIAWLEGKDFREAAFTQKDISKFMELLNIKKFRGTHASGFIIQKNIKNTFPIIPSENPLCIELDLDLLNILGIEKYDFLGLTELDIIYSIPNAKEELIKAKILKESGEFNSDLDPQLQKEIIVYIKKYPLGIFQIGTPSCIPLLRKINPNSFEELTHLISLNRPGPRESGMVFNYVNNIPDIKSIKTDVIYHTLRETRGCCIFQEQLITIIKEYFNLSFSEAEELRRLISKKKSEKLAIWEKKLEISSSKEKQDIWNQIQAWANYGFNKSHAVGYAAIAFISGFLKMRFPEEFYCAALNFETDDAMKRKLIKEARKQNILFMRPQLDIILNNFNIYENLDYIELKSKIIKTNGKSFVIGKTIFLGLNTIGGIKDKQANNIIQKIKTQKRLTQTQINILKNAGFWGGENVAEKAIGDTHCVKNLNMFYEGLAKGKKYPDILTLDLVHIFPHNNRIYCEDNDAVYECICIPEEIVLKPQPVQLYRIHNYVIQKDIYDSKKDGEIIFVSPPYLSAKNHLYKKLLIKISPTQAREGILMENVGRAVFSTIHEGELLSKYNFEFKGRFLK